MKRTALFFAILLGLFLVAQTANAQTVGNQNKGAKTNWVDSNGNGICDKVGISAQGPGVGKGHGKKDGTGTPLQPKDGTDFGAKNHAQNSDGTAAGTGSGSMMRRGKK